MTFAASVVFAQLGVGPYCRHHAAVVVRRCHAKRDARHDAERRERTLWILDHMLPRERDRVTAIMAEFNNIRTYARQQFDGARSTGEQPKRLVDFLPEPAQRRVLVLLAEYHVIQSNVLAREHERNQPIDRLEPALAPPRSSLHPEFTEPHAPGELL